MDDLERDALGETGGPKLLRLVHRGHATLCDLSHEAVRALILENVVFDRVGLHYYPVRAASSRSPGSLIHSQCLTTS
jgi:hypothetical protein